MDFCEYCNQRKDNSYGRYFGPHDSVFMCLDCSIKEQELRIKAGIEQLNVLLLLKEKLLEEKNEMS